MLSRRETIKVAKRWDRSCRRGPCADAHHASSESVSVALSHRLWVSGFVVVACCRDKPSQRRSGMFPAGMLAYFSKGPSAGSRFEHLVGHARVACMRCSHPGGRERERRGRAGQGRLNAGAGRLNAGAGAGGAGVVAGGKGKERTGAAPRPARAVGEWVGGGGAGPRAAGSARG